MCYQNSKKEDPTLLKRTSKDDENRTIKYRAEKHGHEKFLKKKPEKDKDY